MRVHSPQLAAGHAAIKSLLSIRWNGRTNEQLKKRPRNTAISPQGQEGADFPVSRTKQKKADHALRRLGERLVGLSEQQLERLGLSDELLEAVALARKTTRLGARHRQVKYIGSLLRRVNSEPIKTALDDIARGDHEIKLAFKTLELWRDQLRNGNMTVVSEILSECPHAERQRLVQLARNARKEFDGDKGAIASKTLFRYLKEIWENKRS